MLKKIKILNEILKYNAKNFSNLPALTIKHGYRNLTYTFLELYNSAKKTALFLNKLGLKKGDKLVILAQNSPYWVITYCACLLEGIIIVPLNIQSTKDVIEKILKETDAKLIVSNSLNLSENIQTISPQLLIDKANDLNPEDFKEKDIYESDTVEIMYTSGTTGDPKGVILTHENIAANVNAVDELFPDYKNNNCFLSILPLSHIFEQTAGLFMPMFIHAQVVYAHRPTEIVNLLKEFKVTTMLAVPEFLHVVIGKVKNSLEKKKLTFLWNILEKAYKKNFSQKILRIISWPIRRSIGPNLQVVASGGAPLDIKTEEEWNMLGIELLQGYGLTETAPVISTNTFHEKKVGSVGKPLNYLKLRLKDGEIQVKGKNVFQGYYKNQEATENAFEDGWFKTGDLGELDNDGFLYIKGRKKYMILGPGGQNVYPEDIESVLRKNEKIKDAAVIGVEKNGNTIIYAFVIPKDHKKFNADKVIAEANTELASFQQIVDYSVWQEEDFPRTPTRKVQKNKLLNFVNNSKKNNIYKPNKLINIIAQVSGIQAVEININKKIGSLNLDSLKKAELTARIIEEFNIQFNEQMLDNKLEIKDLEQTIMKAPTIKPPKKIKKYMGWFIVKVIRFVLIEIVCLVAKIFIRLKVTNKKYLNLDKPSLIMPNHTAYLDPIVIFMSIPRKYRTKVACAAAQDILFSQYKWLSPIAEFIFFAFPIGRGDASNVDQAFSNMGQVLDMGYSVLFFPEGKINTTEDNILPLKNGAGLAAIVLQAPVIAINIKGLQVIQPYEKIIPRKIGKVRVYIQKPIKFDAFDDIASTTKKIYDKMDEARKVNN